MAGFILDRFDTSQQPIEVDHAITIKQTGLTWVGQYYSKFGEILLENMLHLSENFAGPVPPNTYDNTAATFGNLQGQLWYDTDESDTINGKILKIYDGNGRPGTQGWKRIEPILSETRPTTYTEGEVFYNTTSKTLEIARNNRWEKIGVETAYDSERLIGIDGIFYMRKDIDQTMNGVLTTRNIIPQSNRSFDLGRNNRRWRQLYVSTLDAEFSTTLPPLADKTYDLGTSSRYWDTLYVDVIRSNNYTDVIPLADGSFSIGNISKKWNTIFARNSKIDAYDTILPSNSTQNIGSLSNRWQTGYFNNLDVTNLSGSLIPTNPDNIGSSSNPWDELYVNVIKATTTETLLPAGGTVNLGSSGNKFNNVYAEVIRGDRYLHLLPLTTNTYNIGSTALKWNNLRVVNAYIDFYNTLIPRNNSQSIGTTSSRWNNTYLNILNVNNVSSNLIPTTNNDKTLGTNTRKWSDIYVGVIRETKVETLIPNQPTINLGTSSLPFNNLHVNNIPGARFTDDLTFTIVRNNKSKGIKWSGLTDEHSIYVEEVSNIEKTHLVIESGDNPEDTTKFRNNGNDVLDIHRNKVEAHEDIQAHKRIILGETTPNNGITMEYNNSVGSIEFKFL